MVDEKNLQIMSTKSWPDYKLLLHSGTRINNSFQYITSFYKQEVFTNKHFLVFTKCYELRGHVRPITKILVFSVYRC